MWPIKLGRPHIIGNIQEAEEKYQIEDRNRKKKKKKGIS